jgi:hypothetical protein
LAASADTPAPLTDRNGPAVENKNHTKHSGIRARASHVPHALVEERDITDYGFIVPVESGTRKEVHPQISQIEKI